MQTIVTGSVAYDYIMGFPGQFSDHILPEKIDILSVSFLVDSLRREPGGCAANIAYNLSLLGESPSIMATVGADFGHDQSRLAAMGIDTSLIKTIPDTSTSSFFVSTDEKNCQIASFYVGAMGHAGELSFRDLEADQVTLAIISPNAPDAMAKYVRECKQLDIDYIYDPSQQIVRLPDEELREGIEGSRVFVANEYEYELVQQKTGLTKAEILEMTEILVVTHGEKGSVITTGGESFHIPIVPASQEVDPTGVGDAYRAGLMFGLLHDIEWPVAGRVGALLATYAMESLGTQAHKADLTSLLARYAEHFGPAPVALLDALNKVRRA